MTIRPDIWLLGLPLAAAICGASVWRLAPEIEAGLRRQVRADATIAEAGRLGRAGARVEVEGRHLSVTTDAPLSAEGRQDADRLVSTIAGLRGPLMRVLAPASIQPFTFGVTRRGEELLLSGFVPPGPLRAELLDEAQQGAGTLRDQLRSALGAPPGFEDAARLLLRTVLKLERATASLTGQNVAVAGVAPDSQSYRDATASLRSLPAGYIAGAVEITPPLIRPFSWSAALDGQTLTLGGHVPSEAERRAVLALAGAGDARFRVEDRMDTARGLESGIDFAAMAKRSIGILKRLEGGRIELEGRALTIQGRLAARDLLDSLQAEIEGAKLPGIEVGKVVLEPVVPRPYRFSARRTDGRLHLAGFVPGEGERAAIRALVGRRFPFDAVADDLHLADGAPDGLPAAAEAALQRLSGLAEGEIVIEDRTARLSGRALYAGIAERARADFPKSLPPSWAGRAEVSAVPDKPLDPDFCGDLISDSERREPVRFEAGKAELGPAARKALSAIADVMRRCGTARLTIVSAVETAGDLEPARELAERRGTAIADALGEGGVPARVQASAAKAEAASKAGDRIAFEVKP